MAKQPASPNSKKLSEFGEATSGDMSMFWILLDPHLPSFPHDRGDRGDRMMGEFPLVTLPKYLPKDLAGQSVVNVKGLGRGGTGPFFAWH